MRTRCGRPCQRTLTAIASCLCVLLGVGLCCSVGCNVLGFAAQVFPQKVKAIYRLEPRTTVVLTDDPANHLGEPALSRSISEQVGSALAENDAAGPIVSVERVDALSVSLGTDWDRVGIDQVGRALGAELVVHVHVDSARVFPQPGLLQPTATVLVKVIDVTHRKRLFPASAAGGDRPGFELSPRGHAVHVSMGPHGAADTGLDARRAAMRTLALTPP